MLMSGALALLHILIPVYWLGGDLGAFYSSSFIVDHKRSVPERLLALKILNNIDMAPRTTLILALPTGALLGWAKGWLVLPGWAVAAVVGGGLGWLAVAWAVHLRHRPADRWLKQFDLGIRWIVMLTLAAIGLASFADAIHLPLFIALKLLILASCIGAGLSIRRLLVPLFAPVSALAQGNGSPAGNQAIADVMNRTRPIVIAIWILVLAACLLGLTTPV